MTVCCICDIKVGVQSECISFHRFPKRENRRIHWFTAISDKIKNFTFTSSSQICSQHFTMECFVVTCSGKRHLKANAVPSIFNMPLKQGLEIIQPVQQQLCVQKCNNIVSINPEQVNIESTKIPTITTKLNENKNNPYKPNVTSVSILKSNTKSSISHSVHLSASSVNNIEEITDLRHAKEYIQTLKKKLKVSQQKCRRLQTRVTFLKLLVKHLQDKKNREV